MEILRDKSESKPEFVSLPEVVLREILKKTDKQDIINSRLVCVNWNEIIEDTSQLMKYLKFPIWDAESFLDLQIVKKGKARSISFKDSNAFQSSADCKQRFIKLVCNGLENVEFAFAYEDSNIEQQSEIFKFILENCYNLKEITVQDNKLSLLPVPVQGGGPFEFRKGLLPVITPEIVIASANKISFISIVGIRAADVAAIVIFILQLPKLQEIQLRHAIRDDEFCIEIITLLIKYIQKYQRTLHLKKLTLGQEFSPTSVESTQSWILLFKLCAKYGIVITEPPTFSFNRLFELEESLSFQLQRIPLFSTKVHGDINFTGPLLTNLYRVVSLNVGDLLIFFNRNTLPNEVRWLGNLGNLDTLAFAADDGVTLGLPTTEELNQALSVGLSTLKKLTFHRNDLYNSIQQFHWNQYFPNLKELELSGCRITLNDLITKWTQLESLSSLRLQTLTNLNDNAFTMESENRFEAVNGSSRMAPAIACFKSLKELEIMCCDKLTDACVINGISKCKTLEKLVIRDCEKITGICKNFVQCDVEYIPKRQQRSLVISNWLTHKKRRL